MRKFWALLAGAVLVVAWFVSAQDQAFIETAKPQKMAYLEIAKQAAPSPAPLTLTQALVPVPAAKSELTREQIDRLAKLGITAKHSRPVHLSEKK